MKIQVTICDGCDRGNNDDVEVNSYRVDTGRSMDPSGNGYNTDWEYVDLCKDCYPKLAAEYRKQYGEKSIYNERPHYGGFKRCL